MHVSYINHFNPMHGYLIMSISNQWHSCKYACLEYLLKSQNRKKHIGPKQRRAGLHRHGQRITMQRTECNIVAYRAANLGALARSMEEVVAGRWGRPRWARNALGLGAEVHARLQPTCAARSINDGGRSLDPERDEAHADGS